VRANGSIMSSERFHSSELPMDRFLTVAARKLNGRGSETQWSRLGNSTVAAGKRSITSLEPFHSGVGEVGRGGCGFRFVLACRLKLLSSRFVRQHFRLQTPPIPKLNAAIAAMIEFSAYHLLQQIEHAGMHRVDVVGLFEPSNPVRPAFRTARRFAKMQLMGTGQIIFSVALLAGKDGYIAQPFQ